MHRHLPAVAIVATLAAPAVATDRYFLDSTGTSPNGRYRIDATSPDNAGGRSRPFASNFTYTLTDTTTKKVVWTRQQPMQRDKGSSHASPQEPSPVDVFVNDGGLVVARTAWDSLIVLDPAGGKKLGQFDLLDAFPKSEQEDHIHLTTAGPSWSQRSDWFFVNVPAEGKTPASTVFVVRPFWRHRLVINCTDAAQVDLGAHHSAASPGDLKDASPVIKRTLAAIMAEESARSLAAIKSAKAKLADPKNYEAVWAADTALDTAGFLKLTEAEPHIRELESWLEGKPESLSVMQMVRQSLRALGKVPKPGFGHQMYGYSQNGVLVWSNQREPYTGAVPIQQRTNNATAIKPGMTLKEVCDLIGSPDAECYDKGTAFDWDIDTDPPFTLRVTTTNHQTVDSVRTIKPFAFYNDANRMYGR